MVGVLVGLGVGVGVAPPPGVGVTAGVGVGVGVTAEPSLNVLGEPLSSVDLVESLRSTA